MIEAPILLTTEGLCNTHTPGQPAQPISILRACCSVKSLSISFMTPNASEWVTEVRGQPLHRSAQQALLPPPLTHDSYSAGQTEIH